MTAALRRLLLPALLALCFVAGGAAGFGLYRPIRAILRAPAPPRPPSPDSWTGKSLPRVPQWTLEGEPWSGPDPGRPAVLVFWSTSCSHCLEALSELNAMHRELGAAVAIVGIPLQRDSDLAACVAARKGVAWPQVCGEEGAAVNPLALVLGVRRVPSMWVVDGQGVIRAAQLDRVEEVRRSVAALLAGHP